MVPRDELKDLIDQVAESSLETVKGMLEYQISPPPPEPEVDRMLERHEEYRRRVEEHFRKTRTPATLGGGVGGGGFARMHGEVGVGRYSFVNPVVIGVKLSDYLANDGSAGTKKCPPQK